MITIALDAMGGDRGPHTVVGAGLNMLAQDAELRLLFTGRAEIVEPILATAPDAQRERVEFIAASQVVGMDEHPRDALRRKKQSSMRLAINALAEGRADACVSAGNTGALMATARFVLKTLPGIDRPAILSAIPAVAGHTHMLDLGANAGCTAEHLRQFGVMGSVAARLVGGIETPRVGLLNIGEEEIKGTHVVQEAARLLASSELNYVGFVEGNEIFTNRVDVVVTDGFTGNIALKTMEGSARLVSTKIRAAFQRNWWTRLAGAAARPVLSRVGSALDPRRYNGASLVGLRGNVIKSHGHADEVALCNAIATAKQEVRKDLPGRIGKAIAST